MGVANAGTSLQSTAMNKWLPRAFREGEEPDPRFTLANERTFLAWVRTGLGLIAAAVGFEAFATEVVSPGVRTVLVVLLLLGATALVLFAFKRWMDVESAMRTGHRLPVPAITALLMVLVVGAAITLLVVIPL